MSEITLPQWAKPVDGHEKMSATVEVDSDAAYLALLTELGLYSTEGVDLGQTDQYWLEVAYQCIKMDVQCALEDSDLNPVAAGRCAQINFTRAPRWALVNFRVGRGTLAASKGREARVHYKRLRGGRIPFSN